MTVLGGGFIAAEMGHVFDAFGSAVTIVQRGSRLLMAEDEEVSRLFTDLAAERFNVHLNANVSSVARTATGIAVTIESPTGQSVVESEVLLLATGRRPNTDRLDAAAGGLALDAHGHLVTDSWYRTSVPGVWAIGDAANHFQLKHIANAEVRVVAHNLTHPGRSPPARRVARSARRFHRPPDRECRRHGGASAATSAELHHGDAEVFQCRLRMGFGG